LKTSRHSISSTFRRFELTLLNSINWDNRFIIGLILLLVSPFLALIISVPLDTNDQILFGASICLVSIVFSIIFKNRLVVILTHTCIRIDDCPLFFIGVSLPLWIHSTD
jgi:hypothetical protein